MIFAYDKDDKNYKARGLGPIAPTAAAISETLNGEYSLSIDHPMDQNGSWKKLKVGTILRAKGPKTNLPAGDYYMQGHTTPGSKVHIPERELGDQLFKIRSIQMKSNGMLSVKALHLYYNLADCVMGNLPITADLLPIDFIMQLANLADPTYSGSYGDACKDFNFYTDLEEPYYKVLGYSESNKKNLKLTDRLYHKTGLEIVSSDSNSFVKLFGGEILRDGRDVFLLKRVGIDRSKDLVFRYGKNIKDLSYSRDDSNVITHLEILGREKGGDYYSSEFVSKNYIEHPEWYSNQMRYTYDYSDAQVGKKDSHGEVITEDSIGYLLKSKADQLWTQGVDMPEESVEVSFVNYRNTDKYNGLSELQKLYLGDTVRVVSVDHGIQTSLRVTSYTYNVLTQSYETIKLGKVKDNLYETISRTFN